MWLNRAHLGPKKHKHIDFVLKMLKKSRKSIQNLVKRLRKALLGVKAWKYGFILKMPKKRRKSIEILINLVGEYVSVIYENVLHLP